MSEKIRKKIYDAIKNAPDLKEGNYVSVALKKTGFLGMGKNQIELRGRASSEKAKAHMEEIAKGIAGNLEVVSEIRITSSTG
jgi:hypothetical protein